VFSVGSWHTKFVKDARTRETSRMSGIVALFAKRLTGQHTRQVAIEHAAAGPLSDL